MTRNRITVTALALVALIFVPANAAASTWETVATVKLLEGEIGPDGAVITSVTLHDGRSEFTVLCNTSPHETPQVCADLRVGDAYRFTGTFSGAEDGAVRMRIAESEPAVLVE